MELTPDEIAQARICRETFPYRIVYVARKDGEETVVAAVLDRRIPNKLARQGWTVFTVSGSSLLMNTCKYCRRPSGALTEHESCKGFAAHIAAGGTLD